ncbi:hypothetical protein CRG98_010439 [Punica granatum]|uniref:Uncharacterized protein n=1 Tax=Punica granatum TaxID=22663 RepID=A0A2I0KKX7_PUNGR|nr:hypothetical protein CRG98_010439 [Punica granatum]
MSIRSCSKLFLTIFLTNFNWLAAGLPQKRVEWKAHRRLDIIWQLLMHNQAESAPGQLRTLEPIILIRYQMRARCITSKTITHRSASSTRTPPTARGHDPSSVIQGIKPHDLSLSLNDSRGLKVQASALARAPLEGLDPPWLERLYPRAYLKALDLLRFEGLEGPSLSPRPSSPQKARPPVARPFTVRGVLPSRGRWARRLEPWLLECSSSRLGASRVSLAFKGRPYPLSQRVWFPPSLLTPSPKDRRRVRDLVAWWRALHVKETYASSDEASHGRTSSAQRMKSLGFGKSAQGFSPSAPRRSWRFPFSPSMALQHFLVGSWLI